MLVLSRKLGEKIFIAVVDINRWKIRLGIEAPTDVQVMRQELLSSDDQRRTKFSNPILEEDDVTKDRKQSEASEVPGVGPRDDQRN